jgi:hypothetical protein
MTRKRRTKLEMQKARELEMLNSTVRINGAGEDQVIKDLLSPKFVDLPDAGAARIAVALDALLKGQSMQAEAMTKLYDKMEKYDADARRWEEDKVKFMEDWSRKAEEKLAGLDKDVLEAKTADITKKAYAAARAQNASAKLAFNQKIAMEPKVTVTSPGVAVQTRDGMMVEPEVIRIKHMQWILQPGVPTEVPFSVAEVIKSKRRFKSEGEERKNVFALRNGLMSTSNQDNVVAQRWDAISRKTGIGADSLSNEIQSQE